MNEPVHIVCPHCSAINRLTSTRLIDHPVCGKCKQKLFDTNPLELSSTSFELHLKRNEIPLVVDFWAPWCGPCLSMAPAYKQASALLEPQVRMAKLNTQTESDLAQKFDIRSIPTMIIFKNSREISRQSGAMGQAQIIAWVRSFI